VDHLTRGFRSLLNRPASRALRSGSPPDLLTLVPLRMSSRPPKCYTYYRVKPPLRPPTDWPCVTMQILNTARNCMPCLGSQRLEGAGRQSRRGGYRQARPSAMDVNNALKDRAGYRLDLVFPSVFLYRIRMVCDDVFSRDASKTKTGLLCFPIPGGRARGRQPPDAFSRVPR